MVRAQVRDYDFVISGHDDYSIRKKHRTEGNRKEKQLKRPRTRSTRNVADENRSDPCGFLFSWYSKKWMVEKSIRVSYCDRDPKNLPADLHEFSVRCLVYEQND